MDAIESHAEVEASITTDQPCRLLELPKELRLIIYEELLSLETIHIESYDTPSIQNLSDHEVATTRFYALKLEGSTSPQILRTCHQIHQEAEHLLYIPQRLALLPSLSGAVEEHSDSDDHDRRVININRLCAIRKLRSLSIEFINSCETREDDMTYSRIIGSVLKEGLPVGKLHAISRLGCTCRDTVHEPPNKTLIPQMLRSTVGRIRAVEAECVYSPFMWYKNAALGWHPKTHEPDANDAPEAKEMYGYFRDAVV